MAGKEKVDIKRSDQFQEVDEELARAMADLDSTIERVSAIFDGTADENTPEAGAEQAEAHPESPESGAEPAAAKPVARGTATDGAAADLPAPTGDDKPSAE